MGEEETFKTTTKLFFFLSQFPPIKDETAIPKLEEKKKVRLGKKK